jgi:hypothetical protein
VPASEVSAPTALATPPEPTPPVLAPTASVAPEEFVCETCRKRFLVLSNFVAHGDEHR